MGGLVLVGVVAFVAGWFASRAAGGVGDWVAGFVGELGRWATGLAAVVGFGFVAWLVITHLS